MVPGFARDIFVYNSHLIGRIGHELQQLYFDFDVPKAVGTTCYPESPSLVMEAQGRVFKPALQARPAWQGLLAGEAVVFDLVVEGGRPQARNAGWPRGMVRNLWMANGAC